MAKKDTDIHKKDGLFFRGEKVGHANENKKIRKKDGLFTKGEEMGYMDENNNIRKKDGLFFKGDKAGKVKENKAFDNDGWLFKGQEFGYVDKEGNIRQKDGFFFKGRIIGKMQGKDVESTLGYFVLKFQNLADKVSKLDKEMSYDQNKGKYLKRIEGLLDYIPKADSLGDFDRLVRILKPLKKQAENYLLKNLTEKKYLCEKAEKIADYGDLKTGAKELKTLMEKWKQIGHVPQAETDKIWERFKKAQNSFYQRRQKHFDQQDRTRQKNLEAKERLCKKAESLSYSSDFKQTGQDFKNLQEQWNAIGPVPKEKNDSIWARFNDARDRFFKRRKTHFDKLDQERKNNLRVKEDLCRQAESVAQSDDFRNGSQEFKDLMSQWKAIGPVPKEKSDSIWQRFKKAQDAFYQKKQRYFDQLDNERQQNYRSKERIYNEASLIKDTHDFKHGHEQLQDLMNQWKAIGRAPKEKEEYLWKRFNNVREHFYQRRQAYFDQKDQERQRNLRAKEDICRDAENLAYSDDFKNGQQRFKDLMSRWKSIGPVPKDEGDRLWGRFRTAQDTFYERKQEYYARKQAEWQNKMESVLKGKHEFLGRLRSSIEHDQHKLSEFKDKLYNVRPGKREYEIRNNIEGIIDDIENKIQEKKDKVHEVKSQIREIEDKLRGR